MPETYLAYSLYMRLFDLFFQHGVSYKYMNLQ